MIRDILSIRRGECRYCITDDTPFFFCGDPVQPESSYCPEHHALCHNGFGKDVALLERMIVLSDWSVVPVPRSGTRSVKELEIANRLQESPVTVPVDIQIRGRE